MHLMLALYHPSTQSIINFQEFRRIIHLQLMHLPNSVQQIQTLIIIFLTQMNKSNYDMPLQPFLKSKIPTQNSVFSLEQLISPLHTQQQIIPRVSSNCKYDLPCQRLDDHFLQKKFSQNRPFAMKNHYNDMSKHSATTKSNQIQMDKKENQINYSNIRSKVSSIYQKLLEQNNNKKKEPVSPIFTQATFKPKQLSKQISRHRHHQSASTVTNKRTENQILCSNQSKNFTKSKKGLEHAKKLEFITSTKTKYEKILEEHFQSSNFNSKKNQFLAADDIRLSKICGKNSVIMKLKERLEPDFSSNRIKKQEEVKRKLQSEQVDRKTKQKAVNNKETNKKDAKRDLKEIQKGRHQNELKKELKHSQSEKWMSMNFYQRQDRVTSNRKQKQVIGKQKKIQKQIQPCTFKPQLTTKCKSAKALPPTRQSYLQQYYQKLNRKY